MSSYKEYLPPTCLKDFVKYFWVFDNTSTPQEEVIIQNGYINLVFTLSGSISEMRGTHNREIARNFIYALNTQPVTITYDKLKCAGVCLEPWASYPMLKIAVDKLNNNYHDLRNFFPETLHGQITDINNETGDQQILNRLAQFCLTILDCNKSKPDPEMKEVVFRILQTKGNFKIQEMAGIMDMTRRGLELKFIKMLGATPKFFTEIIRFHNFVQSALQQNEKDLTTLALDTGYYDQSHLIRECRKFTGMTPRNLMMKVNSTEGLNKRISFDYN
jgi:AraC-like DNA-binding protein